MRDYARYEGKSCFFILLSILDGFGKFFKSLVIIVLPNMKSFVFTIFLLPFFAFAYPGHHARQLSASPIPTTANATVTILRTTEEAIAIATICPAGSAASNGSFNSIFSTTNITSSSAANATIVDTISATPTVETLTETGIDGCSTLYTPATTPFCHTTLSGMGQIPITVTECTQLVTFSTSSDSAAATASGIIMGDKRTYFLAPWQVIALGVVPSNVTVEDCLFGQGGEECSTSTESWTLTTETLEVPITRSIDFQGSIVGVSFVQALHDLADSVARYPYFRWWHLYNYHSGFNHRGCFNQYRDHNIISISIHFD